MSQGPNGHGRLVFNKTQTIPMSGLGQSLQGRPSGKSSYVRCDDAESGSQFRTPRSTASRIKRPHPHTSPSSGGSNQFVSASPPSTVKAAPVT